VKPVALIDIGSNSARMIVGRLDRAGHLDVLTDARVRLKLMRDLGADGRLSEAAIMKTSATLREFLVLAGDAGASRVIAVATAALREARNRAEIVKRLRQETGVGITVLNGSEEARLACLGAVHGLPVENGMLLDVGGGSLELAQFQCRRLVATWTLPLGALRLSDRFFPDRPPRAGEVQALEAYVSSMLLGAGVPALGAGEQAVGTGGTIRSVAKMQRASAPQAIPRLHAFPLRRSDVAEIARKLASRPAGRLMAMPGLSADRVDSIVGGAHILTTTLHHLGARDIVVSGQGLREGLAFQLISKTLPDAADVRRASVAALASRFRTWTSPRAEGRRRLAAGLLPFLYPDVPNEIGESLEHAATLMDIGRGVDFYNRSQHTASMVIRSDLTGFSQRGIALIAGIAVHMGGGRVRTRGSGALLSPEDGRCVERAAIVLLLADEISARSAPGLPPRITHYERNATLVLKVTTSAAWPSREATRRFRRAFGRRLEIECQAEPGSPRAPAIELK